MTLSITTICHYVEFRNLYIVMLNVVMLSVVMLSVVMLSVVMLSVIMLSVVMLNVVVPDHGQTVAATCHDKTRAQCS
jgi:hypothetical protein